MVDRRQIKFFAGEFFAEGEIPAIKVSHSGIFGVSRVLEEEGKTLPILARDAALNGNMGMVLIIDRQQDPITRRLNEGRIAKAQEGIPIFRSLMFFQNLIIATAPDPLNRRCR